MRMYPMDQNRIRVISTGAAVKEVQVWVALADGSRRPDPTGRQELDDQGRPLWRVEALLPADPSDERDKTETIEVTVASKERPNGGAFGDVLIFENLVMVPGYFSRKTSQMTTARWFAEGIRGGAAARPAPQKDAA